MHTLGCLGDQLGLEQLADCVVLPDERFQVNRLTRAVDRLQHRRIELAPVAVELKTIAVELALGQLQMGKSRGRQAPLAGAGHIGKDDEDSQGEALQANDIFTHRRSQTSQPHE